MLRIAVTWAGRRTAAVVTLLYLAGVIAPSVGLALSDGAMSAYCFDEIAEQVAASPMVAHVHVHPDGSIHNHDDHGELAIRDAGETEKGKPQHQHSHDAGCCGAFGFLAVLPQLNCVAQQERVLLAQPLMLAESLAGCGPARIDRPPIALSTI